MRFAEAVVAIITQEGHYMTLSSLWEYDEGIIVREGKLYKFNHTSAKPWDGTVEEFDSDKWRVYELDNLSVGDGFEDATLKRELTALGRKYASESAILDDEPTSYPSKKQMFIMKSKKGDFSKVVLGIRMPDGTKEIIINDNVEGKVDYISQKYDDNLTLGGVISIEEYMFISK